MILRQLFAKSQKVLTRSHFRALGSDVNKPKSGLWNHLETEAQDYHLLMQQYQLKVLGTRLQTL